ncbi:MAG: prolipoprotein diacylglyceryl transferase [Myxococcota bacterium]
MHPILFELAGYRVASYGVALVLAFAVGIAVARRRADARGLDGERVVDAALWIALAAFVGARLLWLATHPEVFADGFAALNPLRGGPAAGLGLSMHGGVALALAAAAAFFARHRLPFLPYADAMAPSVLLGEAITRLGCFLNGCCHGLACSLPWGVRFPVDSPAAGALGDVAVHPTQLYAALLALAGFAAVLRWERAGRAAGQVFAACLLLLAGTRIGLDWLRHHEPAAVLWPASGGGAWLTVHQVFCVGLIALACVVAARTRRSAA